jgi:hypothetical protein
VDKIRNQEDKKLTIYFGKRDTIQQLDNAYEAYKEQYQGLAVSRNRFFGALIVEGIGAYMKDESIGWAYV